MGLPRYKRRLRALGALLLLLLLLRLSLAFFIKISANQVLEHLERYRGHIDGVGLSFWRGAYQFRGVKIETADGKVPLPLFAARSVDISVKWPALLSGHGTARVVLDEPQLNFVTGPGQDQSQYGFEQDWLEVIHKLIVVKADRVEIHGGQVHFADPYQTPPLDMHLSALEAKMSGLRSPRAAAGGGLPCALTVTALWMDEAPSSLQLNLDALNDKPTFDYSFILQSLDLSCLDPFFRRYMGIEVAGGQFSVYSEGKSDEGDFKGYVKPMVKDLKVIKTKEKIALSLAKRTLIGLLAWVFKDHIRDTDATRIPLTGDLLKGGSGLKPHLVPAFFSFLGNAFIRPISAKLDVESDLHEFKAP